MTQRIFDIENEKDMALLWSILPESCRKITVGNIWDCIWEYGEKYSYRSLFKINWHNKTEITRPIQEATEEDIGKLCAFWNFDGEELTYGILYNIKETELTTSFSLEGLAQYLHARRLTKQEIEEIC